MAVLLTASSPTIGAAVTAATADATGNYVIPAGQNLILRINNGSASSMTVTLDDPTTATPEGTGVTISPDPVLTIAAGAARYVVLNSARRARFTDPATGRVSWTYSLATTVTVEVVAA